jgi:hypothetical protein
MALTQYSTASVETIRGARAMRCARAGREVIYGFQSKMRRGRMASGSSGRHPIRESAELGWFIVRGWFNPGRKSMLPYSIQWLMRFKPAWFRHALHLCRVMTRAPDQKRGYADL